MEKELMHNLETNLSPKHFEEYYAGGSLKEVTMADVPPQVMQRFEGYSSKFISPKEYQANNFSRLYIIEHENGDQTYIAEQIKTYDKEKGSTEELAYFIEMRGDVEIGHGELRRDISKNPLFEGAPFIGFTGTEKQYQRQRLGERRLGEMNAFAQMRFGRPLESGDIISDDARAMFEKLEEEGKVESYTVGRGKNARVRFRMK